jgi:hypothetical protein
VTVQWNSLIRQGFALGPARCYAAPYRQTGGAWLLDHYTERRRADPQPELYAIIARIRERGAIATLITNGLLLTPERIQKLNAAGLDYLQISIDNSFSFV